LLPGLFRPLPHFAPRRQTTYARRRRRGVRSRGDRGRSVKYCFKPQPNIDKLQNSHEIDDAKRRIGRRLVPRGKVAMGDKTKGGAKKPVSAAPKPASGQPPKK
jgi:hypothetical protein